jgi:hypothetical protein
MPSRMVPLVSGPHKASELGKGSRNLLRSNNVAVEGTYGMAGSVGAECHAMVVLRVLGPAFHAEL